MAVDRRIKFGTYVVPTRIDTMEEDTISKTSFQTSPGKTLGGKGSAEIDTTQWNDAWTSMRPTHIKWEDMDDTADTTGNRWEDTYDRWDGDAGITTTAIQLASDSSDLHFCYIKNTGSTAVIISLDTNSTYPLKLSGGASTMFRGYSTNLKINEVLVKTASGTSTIEYLIAQ